VSLNVVALLEAVLHVSQVRHILLETSREDKKSRGEKSETSFFFLTDPWRPSELSVRSPP